MGGVALGLDVNDVQSGNVDVVVVLRYDGHAKRNRSRRNPGIVDGHPEPEIAQADAQCRPSLGDGVVDRDRVQGKGAGQRGEATITDVNIGRGEDARPELSDRDHRYGQPVRQRILSNRTPGFGGNEDTRVRETVRHLGWMSSVLSGASARRSARSPASA